jgi:squalene-hopene/tetraprenyl-beta-curcumene cyclase
MDRRNPTDAEMRQEGSLPAVGIAESAMQASAAARRGAQWLQHRQTPQGYWCGELEGDSILQSEYLLYLAWLGREESETARKVAKTLLRQQLPDGGWGMFPGGSMEISGSVKAYFALKLAGYAADSEPLTRARTAILAHGGADAVNSFTRFYLALLGQISYELCPAVPPEMVLLPDWLPFNIYRMSAWSRTIFVPLALVWAHRPVREIRGERGIGELFLRRPEAWPELRSPGDDERGAGRVWRRFFLAVDATLHRLERWGWRPLRRRAIEAARQWVLERFEGSDGLGAIFPPMIWSAIALRCLGFAEQSEEVQYCEQQLNRLMIEEQDSIRIQPCESPVWDTALTIRALAAANAPASELAMERGVDWLLSKEVRRPGDWARTVRAEPGGWYFEYRNAFYPDIDDTIMVLMALREQNQHSLQAAPVRSVAHSPPLRAAAKWLRNMTGARCPSQGEFGLLRGSSSPSDAPSMSFVEVDRVGSLARGREHVEKLARLTAACQRGIGWTLAMQNRDGGWGAFDKDNDARFLCHVPFADHNAMIDPSTPDITGRVLEMLGQYGFTRAEFAVERAVEYLRETQESDGSWFGRWGVNHIYGTWQVLVGLRQVGASETDRAITGGVAWLLRAQQPSGGWGESAASYADDTLRGRGPATASQTAWALLGLIAAGMHAHPATRRGVSFLLERQLPDGSWSEPEFTGTGFPRVFYLRYHLYPQYFPTLALAQWARLARE